MKAILDQNASLNEKIKQLQDRIRELGDVSPLMELDFSKIKSLQLSLHVHPAPEIQTRIFVNGRLVGSILSRPQGGDYPTDKVIDLLGATTSADVMSGLFLVTLEFTVPQGSSEWHVNAELLITDSDGKNTLKPRPFYWDISRNVVEKSSNVWTVKAGEEIRLYGKRAK